MTKNSKKLRVRIAPSPTGPLHLGTARSALYNYLFAKQNSGKFILRIEDTDLERSDNQYTQQVLEGLKWLGIEWNEGPTPDGKEKGQFGPYKQSERGNIYEQYIKKLLAEGKIYPCYCTHEELEAERKKAVKAGEAPKYSGRCRSLSELKQKQMRSEGRNSILRFRTPPGNITFNDTIRGELTFDSELIGDFSVAREEKTPLYNLAVVIDDYTMEINYVIRGEDHISNTPKQILLQEALGFPRPQYAHLPLILNPDRSKLSKRKNKVSINDYRNKGYLPEAMINFLVLLGWNPKTKEEIFDKDQLIKKFKLEDVHKGGAVFNQERLDWINGHYIRKLKAEQLFKLALPYFKEAKYSTADQEYIKKIVPLERERIKKLSEIPEMVSFFFSDIEYDYELLIWKKTSKQEISENLKITIDYFSSLSEKRFNQPQIEQDLQDIIKENKINTGSILWPLRVALTGRKASPGPFEVAAAMGKEKVLARLNQAISKLA